MTALRILDLFCGAGGAAIPPAFTRYIGEQFAALERAA